MAKSVDFDIMLPLSYVECCSMDVLILMYATRTYAYDHTA